MSRTQYVKESVYITMNVELSTSSSTKVPKFKILRHENQSFYMQYAHERFRFILSLIHIATLTGMIGT